MKQRAAAIVIIAIVAACSSAQETGMGGPARVPSDPATECPAPQLSYLVGQRIGEIDTQSLPHPHRVVPHGMAVTMEYRSERTTIWLDEADRVERVICG